MNRVEQKATMFDWLMEQAGHIQDDSFKTIELSADDATREWSLRIGDEVFYGNSKEGVINVARNTIGT